LEGGRDFVGLQGFEAVSYRCLRSGIQDKGRGYEGHVIVGIIGKEMNTYRDLISSNPVR
jgi:hypothetical protein